MAILTENIREKLAEMFGVISEEEGFNIFDLKLAHRNAAWDIKVVLDRLDGYVRFKGKKARLVIAGPSRTDVLVGRIAAAEEDSVTLLVDEEEQIINYRTIKKANLEVEIPGFSEPKMRNRRKKKDKTKSR
jgi:ribosome maturation factor RimP